MTNQPTSQPLSHPPAGTLLHSLLVKRRFHEAINAAHSSLVRWDAWAVTETLKEVTSGMLELEKLRIVHGDLKVSERDVEEGGGGGGLVSAPFPVSLLLSTWLTCACRLLVDYIVAHNCTAHSTRRCSASAGFSAESHFTGVRIPLVTFLVLGAGWLPKTPTTPLAS